uniref:Glycine N-acyltransferase-like protein n=1 Tax=Chelonoidis abingdonii TaxID=106734 RepID=A0A8C0IJL3_CHEAB
RAAETPQNQLLALYPDPSRPLFFSWWPLHCRVYGTVMHVNCGNPAGQEVLVDSWPEFKMVLTRPCREVAWDPSDYFTNLHTAFYRDEGACQALLGNSHTINWDQAFQIQGEPLQPCSIQLLPHGGRTTATPWANSPEDPALIPQTNSPNELLTPSSSQVNPLSAHPTPSCVSNPPALCCRPEKGLRLAPVSPTHAVLLRDTWMFGGNSWSLRYLSLLIRHFPNACLLDPEGTPISWSLVDPLAALTHGYTLPEHRGRHHTRAVVGMLAAQLHACGFPVYTRVLPHNEPSLHTLQRLGFHILPGVFYLLVVRPGFTQSQPASALDSDQDPAPSSGEMPRAQ